MSKVPAYLMGVPLVPRRDINGECVAMLPRQSGG